MSQLVESISVGSGSGLARSLNSSGGIISENLHIGKGSSSPSAEEVNVRARDATVITHFEALWAQSPPTRTFDSTTSL